MTLLKDVTDCSTYSVRGLDNQLIAQMNKISPNLLVRIDSLNVELAKEVHPWMQAAAKKCLEKAIAARGEQMTINSAYRTLAAQMLLFLQYKTGRCGITAAAPPGKSNHNNASAIDIEDPYDWRSALESNGWHKLSDLDRMHYDCVDDDIDSIKTISVRAFQQLWSMSRPNDKLADDGDFGPATSSRLLYAPAEGFSGVGIPRVLKLTEPLQLGNDVGDFQLALRKAGINIEKADKVFGNGTDKAVKEFQKAKNMFEDGVVGSGTRKALGLE